MAQGTVKWFNKIKGYGFIAPQNGSKDVFIHISAVESAGIYDLKEGQEVNYEIAEHKGKESATDIKLI